MIAIFKQIYLWVLTLEIPINDFPLLSGRLECHLACKKAS